MAQQFGTYQDEIYLAALGGVLPSLPMTFAEWEDRAQGTLSASLFSMWPAGPVTSPPSGPTPPPSSAGV